MYIQFLKAPKNPSHFVALCFMELRLDSSLKQKNVFMSQVLEFKGHGLFECAYGFFWVNKRHATSTKFFPTQESAMKVIHSK